jgi:DNA-binding transcriptional MocR family regulator
MGDQPAFDELIHAPKRLRICAVLAAATAAEFATLRDALDVSDSVLSKHLTALESAGYITPPPRAAQLPPASVGIPNPHRPTRLREPCSSPATDHDVEPRRADHPQRRPPIRPLTGGAARVFEPTAGDHRMTIGKRRPF